MSRTKRKSPARKSIWPIILMAVGGLLIVGAIGWTIYATSQPQPTPQPVAAPVESTYPEIGRVSVADAKAAYDTGSAVFVDVRDAQAFEQGHIAGALSFPEVDLPQRLGELNPNDWIITYCT